MAGSIQVELGYKKNEANKNTCGTHVFPKETSAVQDGDKANVLIDQKVILAIDQLQNHTENNCQKNYNFDFKQKFIEAGLVHVLQTLNYRISQRNMSKGYLGKQCRLIHVRAFTHVVGKLLLTH